MTDFRKWSLIGAGWLLFALFFATELFVMKIDAGRPVSFRRVLVPWLICAALWFAATPLVLWLARRFPFDRRRWFTSSALHLLASFAVSFILIAVYTPLAVTYQIGARLTVS